MSQINLARKAKLLSFYSIWVIENVRSGDFVIVWGD